MSSIHINSTHEICRDLPPKREVEQHVFLNIQPLLIKKKQISSK